jgi:predicted amidohydrolase YtcJ
MRRALDAVAAEVRRLPLGAPLIGVGWDDTRWGRLPARDDLDRVVPDRPALLLRKDGHLLVGGRIVHSQGGRLRP